jgi:hypothetical protein
MKKTFLAFATLFLFMAINAQAQQEFVWEHYKMSIELPDDFKVIHNTDNEFECDGVGMHLYMYVYEDHNLTAADMHKATKDIAKTLKFEVKDEEYDIASHDGFEGKYVLGYKDGLQLMLCGLINKKNATNFWVVIVFEDGDHTAEDEGLKILNSLENEN